MKPDGQIPLDPRIPGILDLITQLASSNFEFKIAPSEANDEVDGIILGLNMLGEELNRRGVEIRHLIGELKTANKELESFAYSVAHDLRAPLRGIGGFSQALLEDYGNVLDGEGKEYLQDIRGATHRMGELIDDLLQLSKVMKGDLHRENVDLSKIAHKLVSAIQKSAPQRKVDFVITDGLEANGDSNLLEAVLANLFDNAFKFTSKHAQARIEFAKTLKNGKPIFFIKDDGAGFDMAYVNKLFGTFERLHSEEEFSGTGIGLATVQRIIHRHGGRVWAEGELEKGAIFYFSI